MKTRIGAWIMTTVLLFSLLFSGGISVVAEQAIVANPTYLALPAMGDYADGLGLDDEELEALRAAIFAAAANYEDFCDISSFAIPITDSTVEILTDIVFKGDPEIFHIKSASFSQNQGRFTKVNFLEYQHDKTEYQRRLQACDDAVDALTADLSDSTLSDVEKALLLHDRLVVLCAYDYENYENRQVPHDDYTMYGALVKKVAVCEGYVQAYDYLLQRVGIESYMCTSYALGHAWNIVIIDSKPYHVDVTWDDPVEDITGRVSHDNFLRSSAGIYENDHEATDYDVTPTDTTYDEAFWQNSNAAFQLLDGRIYYLDSKAGELNEWDGTSTEKCTDVKDRWTAGSLGAWPGNFARLGSDETYLYYTLSDAVYRYDPETAETAAAYKPQMPEEGFSIYGFDVANGYFYCDLNDSPNFALDTKETYQIRYPYRETTVRSLAVTQAPAKTAYWVGEELDTAGLQLTVTYTSNVSEPVTAGYTVSGYDANTAGKQTLTVTYLGLTATFDVTVTEQETPPEEETPGEETPPEEEPPIERGNVDGDEDITSTDARLVLQVCANKVNKERIDASAADVDRDGGITSTDARLILQYCAGKIPAFPN